MNRKFRFGHHSALAAKAGFWSSTWTGECHHARLLGERALGGRSAGRTLDATSNNYRLLTAWRRLPAAQRQVSNTVPYGGRGMGGFLFAVARSFCSMIGLALLAGTGCLTQSAWAQWRDGATGQPVASAPVTPQVGMVTPSIKFGLEGGGGWARNSFEESNDFAGRGFVGGASAELNYPIGGSAYIGLSLSVLGSGISGTIADPITSNIRLLVPIDTIIGLTFRGVGGQRLSHV
jgi:hypothetical protein